MGEEMNKAQQKAFEEWRDDYNICNTSSEYITYRLVESAFEAGLNYKRKTGSDQHFEEFWKRYPNKVKKKESLKIWKRDKLDNKVDLILADLTKRNEDLRWQEGYIPDPTTYLNGERWSDDVSIMIKTKKLPRTNDEWEAEGKKLNMYPGVGESWPKFKDRVRARI